MAGWTVAVDGAAGAAVRIDGAAIEVTGDVPLFTLLVNIAEIEGQPFAEGYGGGQPITAALVMQVSDESYTEPAPTPPSPETAAAAWVQLRMIRDRWLAQTDYVELYLASPAAFTPLPTPIRDAITANSAAWTTWRQALRDLPANVTDPVAAVAAAAGIHASTDTFPSPWPQPPATPVIHLT